MGNIEQRRGVYKSQCGIKNKMLQSSVIQRVPEMYQESETMGIFTFLVACQDMRWSG